MPRRRRDESVDVGHIINVSADIVGFMVDGLFGFMEDQNYTHKYTRSAPAAFRDKSGVICCYRLLNKELREEVDRRILVWMGEAQKMMHEVRGGKLALETHRRNDRRLDLRTPSDETKVAVETLEGSKQSLHYHLRSCFSHYLCSSIVHGLEQSDQLTRLDFSLGTFMCMATERCQIHGPLGGCQCRNVVGGPVSNENWSELKFGTKTFVVYARDKCVDAVCVKPDARFLSHGSDQQLSINTARAMFRMKGVHHPFTQEGICKATNCWGEVSEATASGSNRGVTMVGTSFWPKKIMLLRHPSVSDKRCSLQGVLGLTDTEAKACHDDALRKQQQRIQREEEIKNKHIEELYADVDSYMSACKEFPVSSLSSLGEVCTGMEESVRQAVMHNASMSGSTIKHHGLDIDIVRNGLETVKVFLGPVIDADRKSNKDASVCSSEAYDYLSGLHVGRYGTVTPHWAPGYGNLDGYKAVVVQKFMASAKLGPSQTQVCNAVCRAMRFFDALDSNSLLAFESRPHDPLPKRWLLSNSQMSIVFDAHFPGPTSGDSTVLYKNLTKMDTDIRRLISRQESDIELPPLFTKLTHTNGVMITCSKKASETVKKWYMDCYKLLVNDSSTRCAALDLLGIRSADLIDHAIEREDSDRFKSPEDAASGWVARGSTVPGQRVEWKPDNEEDESDYEWN